MATFRVTATRRPNADPHRGGWLGRRLKPERKVPLDCWHISHASVTHPLAHPLAHTSAKPSAQPSAQLSAQPLAQPSAQPWAQPWAHPPAQSSAQPSAQHTCRLTSIRQTVTLTGTRPSHKCYLSRNPQIDHRFNGSLDRQPRTIDFANKLCSTLLRPVQAARSHSPVGEGACGSCCRLGTRKQRGSRRTTQSQSTRCVPR